MRTSMSGCLVALALAAGVVSAPGAGAAAYPTSKFEIPFGQTWTKGTLTWYGRSVGVVGTHRSVFADSNVTCRNTAADAYEAGGLPIGSAGSHPSVCGDTVPYDFSVPAERPGGAAYVRVCLADGNFKNLKCTSPIYRPA